MEEIKRVAAYCRVSTDSSDQVNSLESQKKYFTDYINRNENMKLVGVYHDDGISGTNTGKRESFNQMIADAESGKIDLIITKEVSRFARNTVDTLEYVRRMKERNVGIIFLNDNINTLSNEGEFRLTIMAGVSQEESRKTSERVKWGQQRRMEQGVVFGRDLLGYTVRGGRLYINNDEAEIVRLIFHKYVNEGKGTHVIARELYEAGYRPMRVKEWSNTVILRVLRNEKYVGDLCQKKTYTPDFLSHKKKYNRGQEPTVYLKDHHEPIIDRDLWDRAQEELKRRSPSAERKSKHSNRYWCSGKIECGECGKRFVSRTKALRTGGKYKAWRCEASAKHGRVKINTFGEQVGCNSSSVNDKVLNFAVAYCIKFIQRSSGDIKKDIIREIKAVQNNVQLEDTKPLEKSIEELEAKKIKAIDLVLDGSISKEDLKLSNKEYDRKIEQIRKRIETVQNRNEINNDIIAKAKGYIDEVDRIMQFAPDDTEIYHTMLDKIVVYSGNVLVVYLFALPFGIRLRYESYGKLEKFRVEFEYLGCV